MSRIKEEYRQHTLLSAVHEGQCKGRVWQSKKLVYQQVGGEVKSLMQELKSWVDCSISGKAAEQGGTPDEIKLLEAVRTVLPSLSEKQIGMLKAHYEAEDQLVTAGDLADAVDYKSYSGANMQYGFIGKALQEIHPIVLPKRRDGSEIFTFYLAEAGEETEDEGLWQWKLRPEMSKVIEKLGLAI